MKKLLGKLIFYMMGWKLDNTLNVNEIRSCVLVCAPHTSNWDFVVTMAAFWKMEIPMKFFIKDDWTKPWYGYFIKAMGGIGVNRSQRQNLTGYAIDLLSDKNKRLYLINTPEGTRSYAEKWKKGFYYIAKNSDVPILFAYADFGKKQAGISEMVDPELLSLEEILKKAEDFYKDIEAKYPEKYNKKVQ